MIISCADSRKKRLRKSGFNLRRQLNKPIKLQGIAFYFKDTLISCRVQDRCLSGTFFM